MKVTSYKVGMHTEHSRLSIFKHRPAPPAFFEYAWYGLLAYGILGQVWGVDIPLVGGASLIILAGFCLLNAGVQAVRVYEPVAWALCAAALVLIIQTFFHEWHGQAALTEGTAFITWVAVVIIAQSMLLRSGFLQRFALIAFAIGLAALPYITIRTVGNVVRAWASGTGISNPNVLGMWFGFCTVYFIFWGLQSQKLIPRVASWCIAVGCLFIVTLSVSRAPLLGILVACIVGFRSALRQSFVPLLSLVLLMSLIYVSGLFDAEISNYVARGAEESGREILWPIALERISNSPWIGVGLDDIAIKYRQNRYVIPHNGLLHIALGAGIVPLICFLGYLARVVIGTVQLMKRVQIGEAVLLPPLIAFALFEMMVLDFAFMSPWVVVVFGKAAGANGVTSR
ncbi:MAG TPA: O-antigen ligase family protein [Nitrospira sp.]|nr:O-antigen ligase family protein [Nitrospira sp.]